MRLCIKRKKKVCKKRKDEDKGQLPGNFTAEGWEGTLRSSCSLGGQGVGQMGRDA